MTEQENNILDKYGKETLQNIYNAFSYIFDDYKNAKKESRKADIGDRAKHIVDSIEVDLRSFLSDNNCEDFLVFPNYESDIKSCIYKLERLLEQ